jgi:hypothetical protein
LAAAIRRARPSGYTKTDSFRGFSALITALCYAAFECATDLSIRAPAARNYILLARSSFR